MALSPKQRLFVDAYVGEAVFNATKAVKLAGYTGTPQSLRNQASANLRIPEIRAAIDTILAVKIVRQQVMAPDEVLTELSAVARIPADGDAKDVKNKVAALALLAKYHGMLIERVQQQGEIVLKVQYGDDGSKPDPDNPPTEAPPPAEPASE